jgi:hypothetical protein
MQNSQLHSREGEQLDQFREIPGLFSHEEIEHIVQDPEELKQEYPGKSLSEAFVERLRKNMTVVLSLDHRNRYFPQVCLANPAFFSKCRVVRLDCLKPGSLVQYATQVIPIKMGNLLQPWPSTRAQLGPSAVSRNSSSLCLRGARPRKAIKPKG